MSAIKKIIRGLKKDKQTESTKKLINYYERLMNNIDSQLKIELFFEEIDEYEKKRNVNY